MWSDTLSVLTGALEVSQVSVTREAHLEAEVLLNMGKVQRMLVYLGRFQARQAVQTLLQAIKISHATDHNLGLMRQAYLEIALIYMNSCGMALLKEGSCIDSFSGMESGDDTPSVSESRTSKKKWKNKKERLAAKNRSNDDLNEQEKERRAAWLAIRCAASVAVAQRNRILLIGDMTVTLQRLSEKSQNEIPDFAALDLVGSYVLGEKKKVYKNEIEEELAPLIEAQEVKHVDTYEEQVQKTREAAMDLSWIQFLGYQTILQRLCSTSTISASSMKAESDKNTPKTAAAGNLGPDFDLDFISHAECDTSVNHDVVRSMLFSGVWTMRLMRMHAFLSNNLHAYTEGCVAVYPPAGLDLPLVPAAVESISDLNLTCRSYAENLTNPTDLEHETQIQLDIQITPGKPPAPPGSRRETPQPSDKLVTTPTDSDVTLQWYQPSLEEADPIHPDAVGSDSRLLLMYALTHKSAGVLNYITKIAWVPMAQLNDLHDRLAVLMQRAEVFIAPSGSKYKGKDTTAPTPAPASKAKKGTRTKPASATPKSKQKDEQLESLLRQCIDDIGGLLGASLEPDSSSSMAEGLPFEVNRNNIKMLEALFDPSFGATSKTSDLTQWIIKLFPDSRV